MVSSVVRKPSSPSEITAKINPSTKRRILTVLSFPILILLAVPFWWYTTSIERLPLPKDRIAKLAESSDISIRSKILFTADDAAFPSPRAGKAQYDSEDVLKGLAKEVTKGIEGIYGQKRPPRPTRKWDIVTNARMAQEPLLRVHFRAWEHANTSFPLKPYIQAPEIGLMTSGIPAGALVVPVHPTHVADRFFRQHLKIALINSLLDLCPSEPPVITLSALKYSSNITLSFVLLNEDSALGSYVQEWDINGVIMDHFVPHLKALSPIHNFTIESQIVFHAPLSFEPRYDGVPHDSDDPLLTAVIDAAQTGDVYAEKVAEHMISSETPRAWLVDEEQMKEFVNSERWSLDSGSTNDPVLRFLLFVPSTQHRPMRLTVPDSAQSFLLPQYGGVVILNPPSSVSDSDSTAFTLSAPALKPAFYLFTRHLYTLLALPTLPSSIHPSPPLSPLLPSSDLIQPFSPWQLDTLLRMRSKETEEEARKTLNGITRLIDKIEEMKVGEGVRGKVLGAVERLEEFAHRVYKNETLSPLHAFLLNRDAVNLANQAFFDPSMMGLLYFPDEHKFAVYTPLFAPIALPMVVGLLREFLAWIKRRKAKRLARVAGERVVPQKRLEVKHRSRRGIT